MTNKTDDHKQNLRKMFDTVAEGYDNLPLRFFPESARYLPVYAGLKGNEHVLDVATGTGHSALALAEALPEGRVTGIDFSEGMLTNAKLKIENRGIHNITLQTMDMQAIEFPADTFDAAVFAFSLFFVEDMEGLLRHATEKVRPGGRILATSFADGSFSPLAGIYLERLKDYCAEPPSFTNRLSTPEQCISLFESAGLADARVDTMDIGYYLADAGQWWEIVWNTAFRKYLAGIPSGELEEFKEGHLREVEGLTTEDGIWLDVKVHYTQGIKPA